MPLNMMYVTSPHILLASHVVKIQVNGIEKYTPPTRKGRNDFEQRCNLTECLRHFRLNMFNTELLIFPSKPVPPAFLSISITGNSNCLYQNPHSHAGLLFFILSIQCFRKSCQLNHQNMFRLQPLHTAQCLVQASSLAQLVAVTFQFILMLLLCTVPVYFQHNSPA